MPQVPIYGQRRVSPRPIPGARKTAAETPLSQGAGEAQARAAKWGAIGEVAQIGAQIGAQQVGRLVEYERQRADEVALLAANNQLSTWERQRLYDPQEGAFTKRGKDALGLPEQIADEYGKLSADVAKGLKTERQQLAFARVRQERGHQLDLNIRRHTFEQMAAYEQHELDASLENHVSLAVASALDPARSQQELADAVDEVKRHGPRLGLGPEQVAAQVEKVQTATHIGVIERLLALEKTKAAQVYYDEAKGQISGSAQARVETALEKAGTDQAGLDTATDLWNRLGPKDDLAPIELDKMEEAARAQYAADPATLKATISYLRERKAGLDAGRNAREEVLLGGLWKAASEGASLTEIQKLPGYRQAQGRAQAQLSDYIVAKAEREANKDYLREGRAAAAEGRAWTREQRAGAMKEQAGWAKYWELSDPVALSKTDENTLQQLRGELGDDHVNRLLTQKRAVVKSEDTVRDAKIDEDDFKMLAFGVGLDAYTPKTNAQKMQLGQLRAAVEQAIDQTQRAKGRIIPRDEKKAIMQGLIDDTVMRDNVFLDTPMIGALVRDPADVKKAYVPLARIPAADLAEYVNYLRGLTPRYARMTDAQIQVAAQGAIEHAYGLRKIGRPAAEIQRALTGDK